MINHYRQFQYHHDLRSSPSSYLLLLFLQFVSSSSFKTTYTATKFAMQGVSDCLRSNQSSYQPPLPSFISHCFGALTILFPLPWDCVDPRWLHAHHQHLLWSYGMILCFIVLSFQIILFLTIAWQHIGAAIYQYDLNHEPYRHYLCR